MMLHELERVWHTVSKPLRFTRYGAIKLVVTNGSLLPTCIFLLTGLDITNARLSSLPQTLPNPKGIAPQIQDGINVDYIVFRLIIDAEREALREHPMESKVDWMNTGKKNQRIKIGED